MTKIDILKQISIVLLLPFYIVLGGFLSDAISMGTGIWDYYFYAIFIPLIGLLGTWLMAPFYKAYNLVFVYFIGIFLAYLVAFPAFYPENHPHAYGITYTPFTITVVWGAVILCTLIIYEYKKRKP